MAGDPEGEPEGSLIFSASHGTRKSPGLVPAILFGEHGIAFTANQKND
jgi:hypothetical protein